jgi:hypothetical protein
VVATNGYAEIAGTSVKHHSSVATTKANGIDMGSSYFEAPVEGDCDTCGEFIEGWAIPHSFNKQTGYLRCARCQDLENKYTQTKGKYND